MSKYKKYNIELNEKHHSKTINMKCPLITNKYDKTNNVSIQR